MVVCAVVLPSLPVCMWEGDTDVGGTVTLTCLVTEGIPTPHVTWEKLEPHHIILPISMDGNKYISISRWNKPDMNLKALTRSKPCLCIYVFSLGELMGLVQIANMSAQDSGVYRCSVTNVLGTKNCYVNLPVYTREFQPDLPFQIILSHVKEPPS